MPHLPSPRGLHALGMMPISGMLTATPKVICLIPRRLRASSPRTADLQALASTQAEDRVQKSPQLGTGRGRNPKIVLAQNPVGFVRLDVVPATSTRAEERFEQRVAG
jgi:hypothetical protein